MCNECGHDLFIDHVTENGTYVYICMNPKCKNYRKAIYPNGDNATATIEPRGDIIPK